MVENYRYDCFLSFAWNDWDFVKELTDELCKRVDVWLCEYREDYSNTTGKKVEEGLQICKHAIVVLSENFPSDDWAIKELRKIQSAMGKDGRRIVPVWLNVRRDYVKARFPILAERLAIMAEMPRCDTTEIATRLASVIKPDDKDQLLVEFLEAISYRNFNKIDDLIYLLTEDDINNPKFYGAYPIHFIVTTGNQYIISLFLSKGSKIDARDFIGCTPLIWAVEYGQNEIAKYLISKGADVNTRIYNGQTALIWEIFQGNLTKAEVLISLGANVNALARNGKSALMHAVLSEQEKAVDFLISKGANVNLRDNKDKTALSYAKTNEIRSTLIAAGAKE